MKQLLTLTAFLFLSGAAFAQDYIGFTHELFLLGKPDARSEAMGRGNGAVSGGSFQTFYNAAASSFTEGVNGAYTLAAPGNSSVNDWQYSNYGASYNTGAYGAAAINYLHYTYGATKYYDDPFWLYEKSFEPVCGMLALNYSNKFLSGFALGINANFYHNEIAPNMKTSSLMLDIGAIKEFSLSSGIYRHDFYAAAGINNILFDQSQTELKVPGGYESPLDFFDYEDYLPLTLHLSGAYEVTYNPEGWEFIPASFIASAEYRYIVHSDYSPIAKLGGELTIMEILKGRIGFCNQKLSVYKGFFGESGLNEVTFGFGISLPIYKWAPSMPLEINADYVNLKNPAYIINSDIDYKKYNLFTISLNARI